VTFLFSVIARRPPCGTLFPYTTLFRSVVRGRGIHGDVAGAVQEPAGAGPGQHDTRAGLPAFELGGRQRVVREQEVQHRMLLAAGATLLMRPGPHAHALDVRLLAGAPVRLGEYERRALR